MRALGSLLPPEWIFRRQNPDYGIDAEIEIVEDENVTNKVLWVQLKSIEKLVLFNGKIQYPIKTKYIQHFLGCRLPVALLLFVCAEKKFYCLFAQKNLQSELFKKPNWRKQKTVTIEFPLDSILTSFEKLIKIATEGYFYIIQQQLSLKAQGTTTYWLDGIPMSDDQELKGRTLRALELMQAEKYDQAIEQFEEIFKVCTISPTERMSLLLNLGNAYFSIESFELSLKTYGTILTLTSKAETGKTLPGKSGALNNMGLVFQHKGAYDDAIKYFGEALKIDQAIRFKVGETADLYNLGTAYRLKGDYNEALKFHHAALRIDREIECKQGEANSLGYIGILYHGIGDLSQALQHLRLALCIHKSIGDRQGEANDLGNIGLVYKDKNRFENAIECLQEAMSIHKDMKDRQGETQDLRNIASIYLHRGDREQASKFSRDAFIQNIAEALIEKGRVSISFGE